MDQIIIVYRTFSKRERMHRRGSGQGDMQGEKVRESQADCPEFRA